MAHRALTPSDIREAYQSQLLERRDDFRDEVKRLKDQCSAKQCIFSQYIFEVAKAAKMEMRARYHAAMVCVEALLEDGWLARSDGHTIDSVYRDVFQDYRSIDRESFSDLTSAVTSAFYDIGCNGPNICSTFETEIGQLQVSAYQKAVAQLRLYRPRAQAAGNNFSGSIGVVQIGNMNSAVVTRDDD
jgi:hypothetical protein